MEQELKEQMRSGKGTVTITHILKQNELGGKCRLLAKISIEPGCSIGSHTHENEEEIFYILKGQAVIDDNGTSVVVRPGDAVLTGGGASHAVENIGDETLEMAAVILLY
jgi:mannose-6-phosphate isomerase-like protein (cupin superfamily)